MEAQRVLLNLAAAELNAAGDSLKGHAIEFGLGNGRTYDHMRKHLTGRRIFVFDRDMRANKQSVPPPEDLILGDIEETAQAFAERRGPTAAFLHADLGNGVDADNLVLERWLPGAVHGLVRAGGLVMTSTRLDHVGLKPEPLPAGVAQDRYYIYRRQP
jgi:hypothetical protein